MLKALLLLLMNLALAGMATAQTNLVPNPSFEDTTYCIGWPPPQLEAIAWHTANTATPDVWNCDLITPCGYHVMDPNDAGIQLQGYKYAYDGDRFAGGYQWYGPGSSNTRDYMTSRLDEPLVAGTRYKVSIFCARPVGVNGAVDHIGVHFGPDSLHLPFPTTIPLVPQARLRSPITQYLVDTAWVEVMDTIEALGNERWMTFGTFEDADDVDGIWLGWGSYPPTVYYYMDQVSVVALEPQGIQALGNAEQQLIPLGTELVWTGTALLEEVVLVDGAGRVIWKQLSPHGANRVHLPLDLSCGSYIAVARTNNSRFATRFIK